METKHLRYVEATHQVWLKATGDHEAEPCGYLSDGPYQAPRGLIAEWLDLVDMVREGQAFAEACEQAARTWDLDPERWA